MKLTIEIAEKMADAACAKASELGIRVTFALVDAAGDLVILKRMDGAPPYTVNIASSMAYTSALFRRAGEQLIEKYMQPWFHGLVLQSGGKVLPSNGGLVLRDPDTKTVLAATGVSGGSGEQDKACAEAALQAIG